MSEPNERQLPLDVETLQARVADLLAANERLRREAAELVGAEHRRRLLETALEAVRQGVAITDVRLDGPGPKMLYVNDLITNASEALGEDSGVITLGTGELFADRDYLASTYMEDDLEPRRYVVLEVRDTGGGMDEETRSKSFDPFFTTMFTGRGLGLAAVLGIVRGHRGAIRVVSESGRGTSFNILFPPSEQAAVAPEVGVEEPAFRGSGRVLVVDDENLVRQVAQQSLEGVGFSVLLAADGAEAVETFRRDGARIDAVLLDMTMPRMGGEEAYREIRRLDPDVKIILSSGFSEQDAIRGFDHQGLAGFLQKPFKPRDLIGKMRELFSG